jgi:hypothetical protein
MFIELGQELSKKDLQSLITQNAGSSAAEITREQFMKMANGLPNEDDTEKLPFLARLLSMKVSKKTRADVERQRQKGWVMCGIFYATMASTTLALVSSCCTSVPCILQLFHCRMVNLLAD